MTQPDDIDRRLEALGRATDPIRPRAGFSRAVMEAIGEEPAGWWGQLGKIGWRWIPVAAAAAAVALVLAVQSEAEVDEEYATAYGAVEVEW